MNRTILSAASDPLRLGAAFSFHPIAVDSTARSMSNANEAVYVRVVGSGTFSNVALRVTTASGNICVGVYADSVSGGVHTPGARVATTGSVACPTANATASIALDTAVSVSHGSHWFGFAADNVTAAFLVQQMFPVNDANLFPSVCYSQSTAFPLPNPAASLTTAGKRIPLIRGI